MSLRPSFAIVLDTSVQRTSITTNIRISTTTIMGIFRLLKRHILCKKDGDQPKSTQYTSSAIPATVWVFQIPELFDEIIRLLPVGDLIIATHVCSTWFDAISSSKFLRLRLLQDTSPPEFGTFGRIAPNGSGGRDSFSFRLDKAASSTSVLVSRHRSKGAKAEILVPHWTDLPMRMLHSRRLTRSDLDHTRILVGRFVDDEESPVWQESIGRGNAFNEYLWQYYRQDPQPVGDRYIERKRGGATKSRPRCGFHRGPGRLLEPKH